MKNNLQKLSSKSFLYLAVFLMMAIPLSAIPWHSSDYQQDLRTSKSSQNDLTLTQSWDAIKNLNSLENSFKFNAFFMAPQVITQNASQTITTPSTISCNNNVYSRENRYYRAFNLSSDFGITEDFEVTNVEFGVESINNSLPVTVNIYSTTSTFPTGFPGSATLRGTATYTVTTANTGQIVNVPLTATIPAGEIMIYELVSPDGMPTNTLLFLGSNGLGESAPSYISATDCGISSPTTMSAIGFPNVHIIMNVISDPDGGVVEETCFSEDFADITNGHSNDSNGSNSPWAGNANFPTVERAFQAGGAVRIGSGSNIGSITSRTLDEVSGDVTVNIDVKGWTTIEGTTLNVTLDGQTENLAYTAVMADAFETVSVAFTDVTAGSTLKIETSSRRAFIDNVEIICEEGEEEPEPTDLSCYTLNHPIVADFDGSLFKWDTGEVSDGTLTGYHFNPYASGDNLAFYFGSNGGRAVSSAATGTGWLVLEPGDIVGPSSTFSSGTGTATNWIGGADGYLGISFPCDAGTCYGYVRMTTTAPNGFPATVVDYCYDPTGAAVTIPGDEEPEPGDGCEWTVTVFEDYFGDEVNWELRASDGSVLLSGGDYGDGYFDQQTVTAEGPLEFYIQSIGTWGDNEPNFMVSNGTEVVVFGQLLEGDNSLTYSDLNCTEETTDPEDACSQEFTGELEYANSILDNASNDFMVANDFVVEAGSKFDLEKVNILALPLYGLSSIGDFRILIMEDDGGQPGAVIETFDNVASKVTGLEPELFAGYYQYYIDLELPSAVSLENSEVAAVTYWVGISALTNSTSNVYWVGYPYDGAGATATNYQSADNGSTWAQISDDDGFTYDSVMTVYGICTDLETPIEGCLTSDLDPFPSSPVTPSCIGDPESLTLGDLGWFGEYSLVNVTEGTEYIFSTDVATAFITIGDETGTTVLASGTASVTWTATTTGVIRFYTHENDECLASSNWVNRLVQCGEPLPAPDNDECEDAIAVSCGDTVTGSTLGANDSGGNSSKDVFFTFTGDGTEQLVTLSLCGSDYDTAVVVYSDCTLSNQIASNDDSGNCPEYQSEVSFVSDGTSTYVILVEGYSGFFGDEAGNFEMTVTCGEAPEQPQEPDFPCFFGDGLTSSFDNAYNIEMSNDFRSADDFIVEEGTQFTMQHITIDTNQQSVPDNVVIYIREDNAGSPGAVIETINTVPTSASAYAEAFSDPIYHMTFDLATPIVLTEGTYWLDAKMSAPTSETVWWLATSTGSHGSVAYQSIDDGATWTPNVDGLSLVFFVAGECETLGINDLNSFDFAYYPNPVKDVLNITTKKNVENVSIFNLAGQKVLGNAKASNGQINVSALATGTYVFRVTLEGGQIETFKIIKK